MFKIFFFSLGTGSLFNSSVCFVMGWGGRLFHVSGGEVIQDSPRWAGGGLLSTSFYLRFGGCSSRMQLVEGDLRRTLKSIDTMLFASVVIQCEKARGGRGKSYS